MGQLHDLRRVDRAVTGLVDWVAYNFEAADTRNLILLLLVCESDLVESYQAVGKALLSCCRFS